MKLLVLTPSFPTPTWGAGTRNYYLLKALATHHTVSLLCLVDEKERREESSLESFVHTIRCVVRPSSSEKRIRQLVHMLQRKSYWIGVNTLAEVQATLDALLAAEQYDAVLFESALISAYRLPAGVKRIIDEHNIEYELLWRTFRHEASVWRKWYNWWESGTLKPAEIQLCKRADLVLTTSEQNCQSLKRLLPAANVEVVPNGVDIDVFQAGSTEQVPFQIVFTGALNYYPNVDAVMFFARHCWPLIRAEVPAASWLIVGREPPPEVRKLTDLPGITVTGSVPDVRPYLSTASVAIAPLQIGSGTRLKILEAFAMKKAVVSTSIGCEGLTVTAGKHLLIADHPGEFARAVIDLVRDSEMRAALGNAGRTLVEKEYSWEACGARLLRALETYMQEKEHVC